jgi:hypothetical protein
VENEQTEAALQHVLHQAQAEALERTLPQGVALSGHRLWRTSECPAMHRGQHSSGFALEDRISRRLQMELPLVTDELFF